MGLREERVKVCVCERERERDSQNGGKRGGGGEGRISAGSDVRRRCGQRHGAPPLMLQPPPHPRPPPWRVVAGASRAEGGTGPRRIRVARP